MRYLILLILIMGFLVCWGVYFPVSPQSQEEIIFNIEKGQGSKEIALNLEKEGLIKRGPLFRAYVLAKGISRKLQAGVYQLSPSMNIPEIAEKFVSGEVVKIKITIPEGFTSEQIYQKLKNVTKTDFISLEEYEGYLFPDTYEITYGMKVEEVARMMLDNFEKKTAHLKTQPRLAELGGVSPEIVIMASLLEKEVKTKEEKELAAGILWKRLKVGMPLQVDAEMWTYENQGLPPKPICNPGLESILAALYPKSSEFWYYLSKPDGETIFQKTLEEHNIAKAKYLK